MCAVVPLWTNVCVRLFVFALPPPPPSESLGPCLQLRCAAGKFSLAEAGVCTDCAAGTFVATSGSFSCTMYASPAARTNWLSCSLFRQRVDLTELAALRPPLRFPTHRGVGVLLGGTALAVPQAARTVLEEGMARGACVTVSITPLSQVMEPLCLNQSPTLPATPRYSNILGASTANCVGPCNAGFFCLPGSSTSTPAMCAAGQFRYHSQLVQRLSSPPPSSPRAPSIYA